MIKHVHICGLFRADLKGVSQKDLSANGAEIWTCNDWYRCYPWMMPDRVFNIHYAPHVNESRGRFPGNWKKWYDNVIDNGGKVSVVQKIEGINPDGQHLLPMELLDKFSISSMGCSISLALCLAIHEGFQKITIHGVRLRDAEYSHQIDFINNALKHCTLNGVQVDNPYAEQWKAREVSKIDWNNVVDVDCGSLKHLVRYFKPDLTITLQEEQLSCQTTLK